MSEETAYKKALIAAMAMCSRRELCRYDIESNREKWKLGNAEMTMLLEELEAGKFINEERYARAFVADKFRHNRWGRLKIASQLRLKGIARGIVSEALETIDSEEYKKTLADLLRTHGKTVKAANDFQRRSKLARFAFSRGFESSLVFELTGAEDESLAEFDQEINDL